MIVPSNCSHCAMEDLNDPDLPVTDTGKVVCRVIWQGQAPHPSGTGMVPVLHLDIAAGQLPNQLEFPMVARWQPTTSYCPNCKTTFYCGPDWKQLVEEKDMPKILVPK